MSDSDTDDESGEESARATQRNTGRKRSATTSDPKKSTKKRKRPIQEVFDDRMGELIEVFKKPIDTVNHDERWVNEALDIWERDFNLEPFEVTEAMFKEWNMSARNAHFFVRGGDNFRNQLVARLRSRLGVEDDGLGEDDEEY